MQNPPIVSPLSYNHSKNQSLTGLIITPSESQIKWWEVSVYRCFAGVWQKNGKTNVYESGRFWSIFAESFPIVSPHGFVRVNTIKKHYDNYSNRF